MQMLAWLIVGGIAAWWFFKRQPSKDSEIEALRKQLEEQKPILTIQQAAGTDDVFLSNDDGVCSIVETLRTQGFNVAPGLDCQSGKALVMGANATSLRKVVKAVDKKDQDTKVTVVSKRKKL